MQLPYKKSKKAFVYDLTEGRRGRIAAGIVATFFSVILAFVTPQIVRVTVDNIIDIQTPSEAILYIINLFGGRDFLRGNIWICGAIAAAVAVLSGASIIWRRYSILETGEFVAEKLRNAMYSHIQTLPYEWHVKSQTGDIIQRSTSDVDTIRNFICNQFVELIRSVQLIIIAVILMLSMDWMMALASLVLFPIIFIISVIYFKSIAKNFQKADEAEGRLQACAQENFTGVRVVRAFGRERHEVDKFTEKNSFYADLWIKTGDMMGKFWGMTDIICNLQSIIILIVGILRCASGSMTTGTFMAFYTYAGMMTWPVRSFGRVLSDMSKASVASGRILEVLSADPETDGSDSRTPDIRGQVAFENVTFAYGDSEPVLKNVSFTLNPGKTMAILGGTGSGKSTLVHLICRLYDVPEGCGRVLIDGTDIRNISRRHLRHKVGLVLQEPFLFSKTIKANIAAAHPDLPAEKLHHVASTAQVHDAITAFADGYDTVVGERGVTLSGGQKQRVAIARSLVSEAPIQIFDDSLSAVDTETDAKIRKALKKEQSGVATIIISHRTSTLMQADKILVLRDGSIEEMGTHEELMASGGSYRRIFDLQGSIEEEMLETVES